MLFFSLAIGHALGGFMPASRLTEQEVAICQRLRTIRQAAHLSRPTFGRLIGVDSSKLANIENLRVPVDWITGVATCRAFGVSPSWLAEGVLPASRVLPSKVFASVANATERTPFSEVYQLHLCDRSAHAAKVVARQTRKIARELDASADDDVSGFPPNLNKAWRSAAARIGADDWIDVDTALAKAAEGKSPFTITFENELAYVTELGDESPMRSAPADLLAQVNNYTAARGRRAELARKIGVTRQRLNEWLSGRSKPNAHHTLLLLAQLRRLKRRQRDEQAAENAAATKRPQPARTGSGLTTKKKGTQISENRTPSRKAK